MPDSHPQLAVFNAANVVPRRAMKLNSDPELPLTSKFAEQVVGHKYFGELNVDEQTARGLAATADTLVEFSPRDLQLYEALAGDMLVSLGYPLATEAAISPEVKAVAERCRRW